MIRFQAITKWILVDNKRSPELPQLFPEIQKWCDVTGQPSEKIGLEPNCVIIECEISDIFYNNIPSNNILWSEEIINDIL